MIGASVYPSSLTTTDACLDLRLKTRRSRKEAVDRALNCHSPALSLCLGHPNRNQDASTLSRLRRTSGDGWKGWLRSGRINGVETECTLVRVCPPESRDRANAVDAWRVRRPSPPFCSPLMALSSSPRKTIPLASGDGSRQRCNSSAAPTASITKRVFFCAVVIEGSEKGKRLPEGRVSVICFKVTTESMQKFRTLCSLLARRFRQVLPIYCHLVPEPLRTTLLVLVITSYLSMHMTFTMSIMLLCTTYKLVQLSTICSLPPYHL